MLVLVLKRIAKSDGFDRAAYPWKNGICCHGWINGIVAVRDRKPYIEMLVSATRLQLTLGQARQVASHIVLSASRIEADAMIFRFFSDSGIPHIAALAEQLLKLLPEPQ